MAVEKENQQEREVTIKITNGDFDALKRIKEDYNLKDESDVIVFAIGALIQSSGTPIIIERKDGSTTKLVPADKLKKVD